MTFETAMENLGTLQRFGSPGAVERVTWILEQFGIRIINCSLYMWQVQTEKVLPVPCYLLFCVKQAI